MKNKKDDMKIALISDIHFGVRKGSSEFLDSQMRFFRNQMIPSLIKREVKHIYFLGDVMDNRNHINVKILSEVKEGDYIIITAQAKTKKEYNDIRWACNR